MRFIFKIRPKHCPESAFDMREPELWTKGEFQVPWPKTLEKAKLESHEIKAGDQCWVWLHVNIREDRQRDSPGLVATAIIGSAHKNPDESRNDQLLLVRFSEVGFRKNPINRKQFEERRELSETVQDLLDKTTSRVAALTDDQAADFENLVAKIDDERCQKIEQSSDVGGKQNRKGTGSAGQGYEADPKIRRAIEMRAMEVATKAYEEDGYQVEDVSQNCPYDLLCSKHGDKQRRVEVKGTRGDPSSVNLTVREVSSAREPSVITDLFIVHKIRVESLDGNLVASGGKSDVIRDWVPKDVHLEPKQYRYSVPISEFGS